MKNTIIIIVTMTLIVGSSWLFMDQPDMEDKAMLIALWVVGVGLSLAAVRFKAKGLNG